MIKSLDIQPLVRIYIYPVVIQILHTPKQEE